MPAIRLDTAGWLQYTCLCDWKSGSGGSGMRSCVLFLFGLTAACVLAGCGSVPLASGGGSHAWVCTQCNVVCSDAGSCPACKCELMRTAVSSACPRCGEPLNGSCAICAVSCVPAVEYFRCPTCGKTMASSGGRPDRGAGPQCGQCERPMVHQTVPIRYTCQDCRVWSSRNMPCPRCGLEMSPQ